MKHSLTVAAILLSTLTALNAHAQTPPPAPTLVEPASGASLAQPMTIRWNPVVDPDGPIGNYTWQVGTTSAFTVVIASGATDQRNSDTIPTFASVSGLPNGTYFWRVRATQIVGGVTFSIDSPARPTRSFLRSPRWPLSAR